MERKLGLLILSLMVTACGPSGFPEPISSVYVKTQSTYVPPTPEKSVAGQFEYFQGLSKFTNVSLAIDGKSRKAELRGRFVLSPADGATPFDIQFSIDGLINEHYVALLRPNAADVKVLASHQIEIGAKLTCLYTDCSDSFIDIYIRHKGQIYHHQVEAQGRRDGVATSHRQEVVPEKKAPAEPKADGTAGNGAGANPDETEEDEVESTPDSSESGYFVGTRESDIKEIFMDVVASEEEVGRAAPSGPATPSTPPSTTASPRGTAPSTPKTPSAGSTTATPSTPRASAPQRPLPTKNEPIFTKRDTSVPSMPETKRASKMQAYGKPDSGGRLVNGVDLYQYREQNPDAGFSFMYPGRKMYFGTDGMLEMLIQLGKYAQKFLNGYELTVNEVSAKYGGRVGHASHQNGLDADIAYLFSKPSLQKAFTHAVSGKSVISEFMVEEQWKLFKFAVKSENVNMIFVDTAIKKSMCEFATKNGELKDGDKSSEAFQTLRFLRYWDGHKNHFHLRIRNDCPANEPRCFQMMPPPNVINCK